MYKEQSYSKLVIVKFWEGELYLEQPRKNTLVTLLWSFLFLLLCLTLAFHFLMVLFFNSPENELSKPYKTLNKAYMEPIFFQDFKLFAPDPVTSNQTLYIRGTYRDRHKNGLHTEWINITAPIASSIQENRFSSQQYIKTTVTHAVGTMVRAYFTDKKDFLKRYRYTGDVRKLPYSMVVLNRLGSGELQKKYPDLQFESMDMKIEVERFPPYAKRHVANLKQTIAISKIPFANMVK